MDDSLVARAQQGDEGAFRDLSLEIGPRLHGVAFGILRERTLAEDATQQALLRIWRKLPRLRDASRFDAWAYRLLVHACYGEARRGRRWSRDGSAATGPDPISPDVSSSVLVHDQLERGFRRLSMDHRTVIVLHHLLELTLDETAEALGVPVGTVRSRLHYAMQGLRAALEADATPMAQPVAAFGGER